MPLALELRCVLPPSSQWRSIAVERRWEVGRVEGKLSFGALNALAAAAMFSASTPVAIAIFGSVDAWLLAGLHCLGSGIVVKRRPAAGSHAWSRSWLTMSAWSPSIRLSLPARKRLLKISPEATPAATSSVADRPAAVTASQLPCSIGAIARCPATTASATRR